MKVSGSYTLNAPAEKVWNALQDPAVLVRSIPGCQQLETTADDEYTMTLNAGVASIKGTYLGTVTMADKDPPTSYTLKASGAGAPGTVDASARVSLVEVGDGITRLEYDADAVVGGAIGGVGQRVLAGVAKKTASEFFGNVNSLLVGVPQAAPVETPIPTETPAAAATGVPASAAAVGSVFRAPEPVRPPAPDVRTLAAAALLGALVALAGVALGGRLSRR